MKHILSVLLAVCLLIVGGCSEQHFTEPLSDKPLTILSHAKEPTLTFLDENWQVTDTASSRAVLTDMIRIGDRQLIATSQGETSLFLFDLAEGKSRPLLELNEGLTALAFSAEKEQLYVSDVINDQVHIIDYNRNEHLGSIDVGAPPTDIHLASDGNLYVLSERSHTVTVIDSATAEVLMTFSVMERPVGLLEDGGQLWIGGHGPFGELNNRIIAYDKETGQQLQEITVGLMPVAFFKQPDTSYLYVLCHGDHSLYKIDTTQNEVVDRLEVGHNPNGLAGNGATIVVTSLDSDTVSVIDLATFSLIHEEPVAPGPYTIVLEESE